MLTLSKHNFDTVLAENEIAVVSFSAHWCAPCRFFAGVCETLAKEYPDVVFGDIDVETELELANEFSVCSVPAVMVLRHRVVIYANTGALTESVLRDLIQHAKAVDIEALLEEVEESS